MIRVGASALTDPRMAAIWPASRDATFDPVAFAARYFGCIEIDATEHVVPRREHVARWAQALADHPRTRLAVRIPRELAQFDRPAAKRQADAARFREALAPILRRERLSAATLRLDASWLFGPTELRLLASLARSLSGAPLVLETVHPSWYDRTALDALRGAGWSLAHTLGVDDWNAPPTMHASTGPVALLRIELHAAAVPALIVHAAQRVRELEREVGSVLVLTSVHDANPPALGLVAALELKHVLTGEQRVAAWSGIANAFPHLGPLTTVTPEAQP